jgi:hypothetical protein
VNLVWWVVGILDICQFSPPPNFRNPTRCVM